MAPYSYALLRIALGILGLVSLVGLTPVGMYWPLDGISPISGDGAGPRTWLLTHNLGTVVGWAMYVGLWSIFVAMTLGIRSDAAVLLGFIGLIAQNHWNPLPLSSAHQVMTVLLFCLLWAESGQVWSIDALRRQAPPRRSAAWPLLLMRVQIALIYGSTGLWKLAYPVWRDGSAVHYALSLNVFHRFPSVAIQEAVILPVLLTWGTLFFELAFPLLVLFRRTRHLTLVAGIGLHLGLFASMELGPFSWIMIASYVAFLDPDAVARFCQQSRRNRLGRAEEPARETLAV